jgi:hypothetical protein
MYRSTPITVLLVGAGVAVGDDLGQHWRACPGCADRIEAQDAAGLLDRTLAHAPTATAGGELAASIGWLQAAFLATRLPGRTPITPPPQPQWRMRPETLPKVRDRLADYWRRQAPDRLATAVALGESVNLPAHLIDPHPTGLNATLTCADTAVLAAFTAGVADALHQASLFWVDATFTDLAVHAGARLPDLSIDARQIPADNGLIMWAAPITATVSTRDVSVVAAHWARQPGGVWTCFYAPASTGRTGADLQHHREQIGWLAPLGPGAALPYAGADPVGPTTRRLLSALIATWLLIDQPSLTDTTPVPADKPIRKAYARARRPDPQVRLVRLRPKPTRTGDAAASTGGGRTYTHRWWVDPYWRDTAYGPGRSLRKRQLVAGSVRGPDDKPLVLKPAVRVLGGTHHAPPPEQR